MDIWSWRNSPFFWGWTAWALYWLISAARAKRAERSEPLLSRTLHLALLLIGVDLLLEPRWLGTPQVLPQTLLTYAAGVALLFAGLGFAVWARARLAGNWSGTVTIKSDHELISSGPYRWVRHPIYTGLLVAFLGTAVASGELRCFVGVAIIAAAFIRKLSIEERMLGERFGEEYARYRSHTAALIPRVF